MRWPIDNRRHHSVVDPKSKGSGTRKGWRQWSLLIERTSAVHSHGPLFSQKATPDCDFSDEAFSSGHHWNLTRTEFFLDDKGRGVVRDWQPENLGIESGSIH
jgi:hypothetical protein